MVMAAKKLRTVATTTRARRDQRQLGGINDRLDSMQTAQGGAQDRNNAFSQGQQGGPQASGTGAPPDILGGYHAATLAMGQHMADVHEQVSGTQASLRQRAANYAARVPGAVQQTGTGNGMSEGQSQNSMAGALGGSPMRPNSGTGQSQRSFENTRFMGGQS